MTLVRQPAVANQFYTGNEIELQTQVDGFLNINLEQQIPKAIIAPHAGYIYSGMVAGKAYASLKQVQHKIKKVVLLGPAHRFGFHGIASSNVDYFQTPLGNIPIAKDLVNKALTESFVFYEERAFDGEHCLEVQLPFLQTVLDYFEIAPFIVGDCQSSDVASIIEKLWGADDTLIVISSDLSHFLDYDSCVAKDHITAQAINNLQYKDLAYNDACGRTPVKALLRVADQKHLTIQQVDLRNSGDTAGSKDRVVGYGSWLFY